EMSCLHPIQLDLIFSTGYLSISCGGLSTMTPTSKKYIVKLTDDELKRLNKILRLFFFKRKSVERLLRRVIIQH
ncbi:hypothetical protein, partial [Lactobacillus delbrueckii]|uniref:hypothetical protein n=1 Tax=Lactobacillus delbrueckii TaxID=1584 RepID=UPI001F3D4198